MIKKLSFFKKLGYALNLFVAFGLGLSFIAPHVPADSVPWFSMIAMLMPFWLIANIILFFYWLAQKSGLALISATLLGIGVFLMPPLFKFQSAVLPIKEDLNVMSFNTRGFNRYEHLKKQDVDSLIIDFVSAEDADIICFQEFYHAMKRSDALEQYPYKYIDFVYGEDSGRVIQAIYSKYPILKVELIEFPKSANAAVYADIQMNKDTIRLYNVHLESFRIIPNISTVQKEKSTQLLSRIKRVFELQKAQTRLLKAHMESSPYPIVLAGDFNNTAYTNIYTGLKGNLQDTFLEAGSGFGRTYLLQKLPMRIDYILADENFEITGHKNYDVEYSDHYPVMASMKLKTQ
ncbi:Endonuclease/exonuclease/phosphatase [Croceitalea dokdonensis DOKDO 023]|uniref:Endonuclease/exonuclease/phosphatase n=1 Tax=Croceitalea dokdonensis DOKDO 023 TaxID=1300341 RepID=A0A0P7AUX6_9FLAO|nr:endonuclease/exonuclease/phosphatase family protein [Croceitalea dokdonensis]KPM31681.1 Endonuclease/exonuclease/phosphatase [Croceitalea dokdonensis DOKDO 023]